MSIEGVFIDAATMKADNNVDSEDLKVNLLTQEIKFAKMLAGNEFNVAIKEKHIKKLSTWLKNRSACSQGTFRIFGFSFFYSSNKQKMLAK